MDKMFIHINKKASFTSALLTLYEKCIVFIKDTQEIWTHGTFYAIPDAYKTRITNLETALEALEAVNAFTTISDGTNTAKATADAKTIKFTGTGKATVTVGADGVTINAAGTTVATGTTNGTIKVDGTDVAVKGLGTAAFESKDAFYPASDGEALEATAADLRTDVDAKVASVKATAGTAVEVGGTATAPTVGLKLNNTGNVTLSLTAAGLSANVTIPAATVTGIKSGDNILSLDGTELTSTLALSYDSTTKKINLTGKSGANLGQIDCTDFIKDGMLDDASFDETSHVLTLTFNTVSGKSAIDVDLSDLVDSYDGSNVTLVAPTKATTYTAPAAGDSVDTAFGKLAKGIDDAKASGVTSFGGTNGAITVKGGLSTNGAVNLSMTGKELSAAVVGLGSAAFTESTAYATSAQGGKADSALLSITKGTDGTYVTTTVSGTGTSRSVGVSVTTATMASASSTNKGLAEASDVKDYVNNLFDWEEID